MNPRTGTAEFNGYIIYKTGDCVAVTNHRVIAFTLPGAGSRKLMPGYYSMDMQLIEAVDVDAKIGAPLQRKINENG